MKRQYQNSIDSERYRACLIGGLKASQTCVFEIDCRTWQCTVLENAEDVFGIPGPEILCGLQPIRRRSLREYEADCVACFVHPEDADTVLEAFQKARRGQPAVCEARIKAGPTEPVWCRLRLVPFMEKGILNRLMGAIMNIGDIKSQTEKLMHQSMRDLSTGLYNKATTVRLIRDTLQHTDDGDAHALFVVDLDDFKTANDTFGHFTGDEVIQHVGEHLQCLFRRNDILGRFGGDEFLVLMKHIPCKEAAVRKAAQLLEKDNPCAVGKSIGIAFYPEDGEDFGTLFCHADKALYQAKAIKNTYVLYGGARSRLCPV